MKLLICTECTSIFNLDMDLKTCKCGKSSGQYIDNLNAEISGPYEPIGFANNSFIKALKMQIIENKHEPPNTPACCKGIEFTAFIIPKWATSVKRINQ